MANEKNTENQSAFKELVLPVIVLVAICLICSALLAVLNDITAPIIEENTKAETSTRSPTTAGSLSSTTSTRTTIFRRLSMPS